MKFKKVARKKPALAAALVLIFGPFGFLYIGWELALACLFMLVAFYFLGALLGFADFLALWWVKWIVFGFIAYKAYAFINSARESTLMSEDVERSEIGTGYTMAVMVMTDAMVGAAMGVAAAAGLFATVNAIFVEEKILLGLVMFFIGIPALVWLAGMLFGFVALGIDFVALAGRGAKWKRS